MKSGALFSIDRVYRYALTRAWDDARGLVMFIGLNPSTADEVNNDPTVSRCISFAKRWGYGGLIMVNLFDCHATEPKQLKIAYDPVGPDNDRTLKRLARKADTVVAAWGNDGIFRGRSVAVSRLIGEMQCLKVNATGEPAHPLYQPRTAELVLYSRPAKPGFKIVA